MELGLYMIGERGNNSRGVRGFVAGSPGGRPRDLFSLLGTSPDGQGFQLQEGEGWAWQNVDENHPDDLSWVGGTSSRSRTEEYVV